MAGVATGNTEDPVPANGTLLFVNITGPTDGRHREASVQTKIRQHVMRDVTKVHRKLPRKRRSRLDTADLLSKGDSRDKTNNAVIFSASSHKGHPEKRKDDEKAAGTTGSRNISLGKAPAVIIPATENNETALNISNEHLSECQKHTALQSLAVEQHPLSALYRGLVGTSKLPAYSLAYAVMRNVKPDHAPGRSFLFPFAFGDAPFSEKVLTGRRMREIVRLSPEQSITVALKGFTDVLSRIRNRLAGSNLKVALSDDTVLSVIDSICYNFAWEDLSQVTCHFDGLHVMVKCRGGLSSFSKQPDIQLMIIWIDVTAALIFEQDPRFTLPTDFVSVHRHSEMSETIWDLLNLVRELESYAAHRALFDALTEATWIAKSIESELFTRGDAAWDDAVFLGYLINPAAHRLLSTPERDLGKQNLRISTACRLGITLFIIILKQQSQGCPAPSTPYVSKVVDLLRQGITVSSHTSSSLHVLQLWLLSLCTVAYPDTSLLHEIRLMTIDLIKELKLNSWSELLKVVRVMPWISKFESRKGFTRYM